MLPGCVSHWIFRAVGPSGFFKSRVWVATVSVGGGGVHAPKLPI